MTYGTTYEQMETFTRLVRERLLSMEDDVYENDLSVNFIAYGDCSLNVRIICYIKTGIQDEYLKITEKVNLALMQIMEEAGVHCAFQSTNVYFDPPPCSRGMPAARTGRCRNRNKYRHTTKGLPQVKNILLSSDAAS